MKSGKGASFRRRIGAVTGFCLAAGLWGVAAAADGSLGGRPFSPPSETVPMPQEWLERGITHEAPAPVDIVIALDQQLHPALLPFVHAFARERGLKVAVSDGTCGLSTAALANKTADMGGFCCPPGLTDRLPGLNYHTIGIGALALIVHPSNPVETLSLDNARGLFGGEVRSWAEMPMSGIRTTADRRVRAVARLHCKLRPGHWRLILDDENQFSTDLIEVSAITDMVTEVARNPGAVGYETLWHVDRLGGYDRVKFVRIDGHSPTDREALAAGDYPLYRVFNITSWAQGPAYNAAAEELAEYLVRNAEQIDPAFGIVSAAVMRKKGWRFRGNEVVGEPK